MWRYLWDVLEERSWSVVSADWSCYLLFNCQLTETQTRSSRQASDHKSHKPQSNTCPQLTELNRGPVKGFSKHKQQMQQPSAQRNSVTSRYHPILTCDLTAKWGKTLNKNMVSSMFYYELFRVHHGKAFWTPPLKTLWAPGAGLDCTRRVLQPSDWTVIFFIYKWWIWRRCTDPTPRETPKDVHVAGGEPERGGPRAPHPGSQINTTQLYDGAAPP